MKSKILLTLALMLTFTGSTFGQSNQSPKAESNEIVMNLPSSPLKMFLNLSRTGYSLSNYSSGPIIKYRIGCVLQKSGQFKVVSKRAYQYANLNPVNKTTGQVTAILFGSSHYFPEELCEGGARLTVIEVSFADGAIWKAK